MAEKLSIDTKIVLNNKIRMPILGFGTWNLKGHEAEQAVLWALQAGYRHIDTAAMYENEEEVGNALRKSAISRDEIFITTKLWPTNFSRAEDAFQESLEKLGLEYVDLYLMHWPRFRKEEAWEVLQKIYASGRVKAIGVSNYSIVDLEGLLKDTKVIPAVNQVKFSPFGWDKVLTEFCQGKNIAVEAYSPLTRGEYLDDVVVKQIAKKYQKSPAQILLRWAAQHGFVVIPKSAHKDRIRENAQIFDFAIEDADISVLDELSHK